MTITTQLSARDLLEKAKAMKSEIVSYRRHIHANPELSFKEEQTAEFVARTLKQFGLEPRTKVGGTGVVVEIGEGKTVAIRADMDALPIEELNEIGHCSANKGVMHACGHDAHTACALGAARLLADNPPTNGRIRIVFQPAEEDTNEDGISGATLMMRDGAFDDVDSVIALHVFPDLQTGKIALRSGPLLAACDRFDIKVQGKGTHGALPHLGVDAVLVASQIVQAMQTIVSRRISSLEPAVVTIGGIRSSTYRPNIVADSVELTGTVRYFHKGTQEIIRREIENVCRLAETMGGSYELRYISENPAVINDKQVVGIIDEIASQMLGKQLVEEAHMEMGAEDFSFLSEKHPSCFICLGARIEGESRIFHTATFDIDEDCLPLGSALLAASALALIDS
ncbi:MAG: amidohydrolase [Candidatus Obscuribacterales bacterium]|nr:amidohydrolase [Candidatus Obscuribacterales bacterium]